MTRQRFAPGGVSAATGSFTATVCPEAIWLLIFSASRSPGCTPDANSTKDAVIAGNHDVFKLNLAVCIHVRDLRAGCSKNQSSGGHFDQPARRQLESDIHVHSGHQRMIDIGHVDFHSHRARLCIDGFRGSGDLAGKNAAHRARCTNLGRRPGVHQLSGGALRHIHEYPQRLGLRHTVKGRRGRTAAGRHQVADVDLAFGDGPVEGRLHLLEFGQRVVLVDLGFVETDLRIGCVQPRLGTLVVRFLGLPLLFRHHPFR